MMQPTVRKKLSLVILLGVGIGFVFWLKQAKEVENYRLLAASSAGNRQAVEALLRDGAEVNTRFGGDGETPLHRAAAEGGTEIVGLLLKERADPNIADSDGATPLIAASYGGHTEAARLLLAAGADPNAAEGRYGMTPLIVAAWKGHLLTVRALLESGADPSVTSKDGRTALSRAQAGGYSEIAQELAARLKESKGR
jgi:ankyrin repeat protein